MTAPLAGKALKSLRRLRGLRADRAAEQVAAARWALDEVEAVLEEAARAAEALRRAEAAVSAWLGGPDAEAALVETALARQASLREQAEAARERRRQAADAAHEARAVHAVALARLLAVRARVAALDAQMERAQAEALRREDRLAELEIETCARAGGGGAWR